MPSLTLSNSLGSSSPFSKLDRWSLAFDGSNDYIDLGDEFKSTIADAIHFAIFGINSVLMSRLVHHFQILALHHFYILMIILLNIIK